MSGNRKEALAAGLKWLFETEQPEGAMASSLGEDVHDKEGNRRYSFVAEGYRASRAPVVVVNVLDKEYEERGEYKELVNGLDEGEMDAVAADLEALGYTVVDRWNGATGAETGSLALEGRAHPSLIAAVALQQAGCTDKGDEHKTGSVFCGCGWAVTGRQLLVRPMDIDTARLVELLNAAPEWQTRPDREQITPDRWGKDHWSLLGYVEDVEVNRRGSIDWRRLTLSARNWPMLWQARDYGRPLGRFTSEFGPGDAADRYGLRLRNLDGEKVILYGHCEADALMDLVEAGLVTLAMPGVSEDGEYFLKPNGRPLDGEDDPRPGFMTGHTEWMLMPWARFRLTELGRAVANELRAHKAKDGATWSNFEPTTLPRPAIVPGEVVKPVEG